MTQHSASRRMSGYERRAWSDLEKHWARKAEGRLRVLPDSARARAQSAGRAAQAGATRAGRAVTKWTPQQVKDATSIVLDKALEPVAKAAVHLLELVTDWTQELMDPEEVLKHHVSRGRNVKKIGDLQALDLKACDEVTRSMVLRWRSIGALEGAGMGLLAMVPVAGGAVALTADAVVVHVLSSAIATRIAYGYGFDPREPEGRELVDRLVRRAFAEQAPKTQMMRQSATAFQASLGRQRWSRKLRDDHQLMKALEKLMLQFSKSGHVSVRTVTKAVPVVSVIAGAGGNSYLLGDVTKQAQSYCRTHFLVDKYDLTLPKGVAAWRSPQTEGD